jgi:glutamyl-tRNA synthetase
MGYLPETMRNYLIRLGWSHGDDEIISTENAIAWFSLESIGRSPARLDFKKLDNLNAHYMRAMSDAALAKQVEDLLSSETPPRVLGEQPRARLIAAMPGLKERAKTLVELAQSADFLFTDGPRTLDDAAERNLPPEARIVIGRALPVLEAAEWTGKGLETATRSFADAEKLKLGQVAQPLRAALTGRASSPPLFAMMEVLGKEESLSRLKAYST